MGKTKTDWPHEIVPGVPCLFCGETPRPVVVQRERSDTSVPRERQEESATRESATREPSRRLSATRESATRESATRESATREPSRRLSATQVGVCEACAVEAYWAWKSERRDLPAPQPEGEPRPKTLRVLLLKLVDPPPGEEPPSPVVPYSYELAVCVSGEVPELPSTKLGKDESDFAAAARALEPLGLLTWEPFVEVLYDAYSARGELTRLVLCTVWARDPDDHRTDKVRGLDWRDWPPWLQTPASAGLYAALRTVLALRLAKYEVESLRLEAPRSPALSVELRRVAVDYVVTQQKVRRGEKNVDTSLQEYSRGAMTDFERRAATKVREAEELGTVARRELAEAAAKAAAEAAPMMHSSEPPPVLGPSIRMPQVTVPDEPSEPAPDVAGGREGPKTLDEAFGEEVGGGDGEESR